MSTTAAAAAFESSVKPDELAHIGKSRTDAKLDPVGEKLPLAGLALSGGGIRSATFNLGILQSLAQAGKLRRFDYLSTVSGGGYIGGWLTAWIHRAGLDSVEAALAASVNGTGAEPDEVRWLRAHSNYLTPRKGLLSLDTLWGVSTYLRNLVTNQLLLAALIAGLLVGGGMVNAVFVIPYMGSRWVCALGAVLLLSAAPFIGFEFARLRGQAPRKHMKALVCWLEDGRSHWIIAGLATAGASVLALTLPSPSIRDLITTDWRWALGVELLFPAFWILVTLAAVTVFGPSLDPSASSIVRAKLPWVAWLLVSSVVFVILASAYITQLNRIAVKAPWALALVGPPLFIAAFEFGILVLIMLGGRLLRPFAHDWFSRMAAVIINASVLPFLVFASWLVLAPTVDYLASVAKGLLTTATIAWLASTIGGVLGGKSSATGGPNAKPWVERLLVLAPYVFLVGLLMLLVWGTRQVLYSISAALVRPSPGDTSTWLGAAHANLVMLASIPPAYWAWASVALVALVALLAFRVDINLFSFHAYYRNRLAQAYLAASARKRNANPFTGYSPADSPLLVELGYAKGGNEGEGYVEIRPYPIINTALNLSGRPRMEWQQRKAASFIFSPLYCGYELPAPLDSHRDLSDCPRQAAAMKRDPVRGHRKTGQFLDCAIDRQIGQSLAITISGAAASPNMGYHTSSAIAALLTAFNVRLGWWMPNPRSAKYWAKGGPNFSAGWMLKELMADADEDDHFVYLSDGGHFENLGVYELLRRRCKLIVASDASADPRFQFEDLANLVHKARADMGIEIIANSIESMRPAIDAAGVTGPSSSNHLLARIEYPPGPGVAKEIGWLVYLKSSLCGDLPADLQNYHWTCPGFPHESTSDQWFNESQFEAYRRLGLELGRKLCAALADAKTTPALGW